MRWLVDLLVMGPPTHLFDYEADSLVRCYVRWGFHADGSDVP